MSTLRFAMAHGAGLMLVPIYLGLSSTPHMAGQHPSGAEMNANLSLAVLVSVIHTLAMIGAGGTLAWLVYRYLGPALPLDLAAAPAGRDARH